MTGPTDPAPAEPDGAPAIGRAEPRPAATSIEPRQRWRLTFARDPVPADRVGRVVLDAWQAALTASGLPLAGLDPDGGARARIAFAAPLPAAARGDAELADIWLVDRRPIWAVREALAPRLPDAHRWVGAEDVWLGAPALAGRVVAADWHIEIDGSGLDRDELVKAVRTLLAARTLPRLRLKGTTEKRYDLRPLLDDVAVESSIDPARAASGLKLRVRTRLDPELGAGRPEEVIAALGEACGRAIEIRTMVRVRLILADELARVTSPR